MWIIEVAVYLKGKKLHLLPQRAQDDLIVLKVLCREDDHGVGGKWVRSDIVLGLLKIFRPTECHSTLRKRVRWAWNCVPCEFIWHGFIIKVRPAFVNWASIYDGKKRHGQHLQHFRPRCAHCDCWVKPRESAAEEYSSFTILQDLYYILCDCCTLVLFFITFSPKVRNGLNTRQEEFTVIMSLNFINVFFFSVLLEVSLHIIILCIFFLSCCDFGQDK